MIEQSADLWTHPAKVKVITTNGTVNSKGKLVMGRGVALQAMQRYPLLPTTLGGLVSRWGNNVYAIEAGDIVLVTFPVKQHWKEDASLSLIARSASGLFNLTNLYKWESVVLPRPGCGNGRRDWETEVKPILSPLLDDRFIVVNKE